MDYDKFTREFLELKPTRLESDIHILVDTGISTYEFIFKNHHVIFVNRSIYLTGEEYFIRLVGTDSEWKIQEDTFNLVKDYFNCANPDEFFDDVNQALREEKIKSLDVTGN